ncbi:hypothetical protein P170DRAFT_495390 [Aspergillus steynii IBT 23096]|uniref:GIY-YIG domain-containing protein n=1 Tax=Aspergillus steynii IBT 23096 TaxID=1392250 RepID=A0A2I2G9A1_9EURO|nr:uncharacterized protein P170DRAFT_495390 [Aspergillus steynii IBT 23096]PLB49413.1 hypothetical protein P170DRAFT_495390 [Aspergillus steynii IBT 23096]
MKYQQQNEWSRTSLDTRRGQTIHQKSQESIEPRVESENYTPESLITGSHAGPVLTVRSVGDKKPRTGRDAFLGEPEGIPLNLDKLGPVDHIFLLDHLIGIVCERFQERYGQSLASLRGLGGMPETSSNSGVYMHILWRQNDPERVWLYVGQASKLLERIACHNDPWYRRTRPSLHYHVWGAYEDIRSTFVTLISRDSITCEADRCLLNIQEMWMACLFQTLTPKHLDEYLPPTARKLWSGRHLNVVPPIWQGFTGDNHVSAEAAGGRQTFSDLILSPDPAIREWARDMRDTFNELRNSPDPLLREYYYLNMFRNRKLAEEAIVKRKLNNVQKYLSMGVWRTITGSDSSQGAHLITCSNFIFTVSRHLQLGVHVGDRVQMQFYLTETPNPRAYARGALLTDPASRLAVSIKGRGSRGDFHVWLSNRAELVVMKMNSLVDALEGFTLNESKTFRRRWYVKREPGSSERTVIYT